VDKVIRKSHTVAESRAPERTEHWVRAPTVTTTIARSTMQLV